MRFHFIFSSSRFKKKNIIIIFFYLYNLKVIIMEEDLHQTLEPETNK